LALEPQFHSFQKDKADMEKVITSIQKEKIELSNEIKKFELEQEKGTNLLEVQNQFITELNYLTVNDNSIFSMSLRSKIDKLGTTYLTKLKDHEDTWK
jgi:fructose-1,6-bisphosphatase